MGFLEMCPCLPGPMEYSDCLEECSHTYIEDSVVPTPVNTNTNKNPTTNSTDNDKNDDHGLSGAAIACIFLVVLAAGAAMYYYVIWPQENKESSAAHRKTNNAVDVEKSTPLLDTLIDLN
jgi:uncharacterized protein HemX